MAYMSQEGYDKLVAELKRLESIERPKASAAIAEAREKGHPGQVFRIRGKEFRAVRANGVGDGLQGRHAIRIGQQRHLRRRLLGCFKSVHISLR